MESSDACVDAVNGHPFSHSVGICGARWSGRGVTCTDAVAESADASGRDSLLHSCQIWPENRPIRALNRTSNSLHSRVDTDTCRLVFWTAKRRF